MIALQSNGWLQLAPRGATTVAQPSLLLRHAPSPNFDKRPDSSDITLLVIHNISLPPGQFGGNQVEDFFCNQLDYSQHPWLERLRDIRVSAHFFIRRDGEIVQFVSSHDRAWHAGLSSFSGRERCNDFSIGIELEGTDTTPYTAIQYLRLSQLSQALRAHHPLQAVRGHEHIAPGRKTDPGPAFNWPYYARLIGWPLRQLPPEAQETSPMPRQT